MYHVGPTLYIIHICDICDLIPLSIVNILLKNADETNLLAPENTDIPLSQEFGNIDIAVHNKIIINFIKPKHLEFHRTNHYFAVHVHGYVVMAAV